MKSPAVPKEGRWKRRTMRILLFSGIMFGFLLIAWGVENWRGKRAWEALEKELAAQGQPIVFEDWQKLRGDVRLDESNFWGTPLLKPLFEFSVARSMGSVPYQIWQSPKQIRELETIRLPLAGIDSNRPVSPALDLVHWQAVFRAAEGFAMTNRTESPPLEILAAMEKWSSELDSLSMASKRLQSKVPVRTEDDLEVFPNTVPQVAIHLSEVLTLRGTARLAAASVEAAVEDVELNEKLGRSLLVCGGLGNHIGERILGNTDRMVFEGLYRHSFGPPELGRLGRLLEERNHRRAWIEAICWQRLEMLYQTRRLLNPPRSRLRADLNQFWQNFFLQISRIFARLWPLLGGKESLATYEKTAKDVSLKASESFGDLIASEAFAHTPGWKYQNTALLVRDMESDLRDQMRWAHGEGAYNRDYIRESYRFPPWWNVYRRWPGFPTARPNNFSGAARGEFLTRMTRIACALELFRIQQGVYPKTLGELAPGCIAAIPRDPLTGKAFSYAPLSNGWYRLETEYVPKDSERFVTHWPQPGGTNVWAGFAIGQERITN